MCIRDSNLGGLSSNPAWQTGERCAQDLATHTNVISGQYMVLGGEYWLAGSDLPLTANQSQSLTINWGRILRRLADAGSGSDCRLNATLQPIPNTLGLGVAIEARGGVIQTLDISGATAHHENSPPGVAVAAAETANTSDTGSSVQVQFASSESPTVQNAESIEPTALSESSSSNVQPYVEGLEIRLPVFVEPTADGSQQTWWQIQSADDWSLRCSNINETAVESGNGDGNSDGNGDELRCQVAPGLYTVIEHISGSRWDNLLVLQSTDNLQPVGNAAAQLDGLAFDESTRTLTWSQPGWYQVQRESDFGSVCESSGFCELEPGIYQIVNHHTGQKWRNFVVPGN